jgi:putative ABC transport system permease protein
MANLVLASIAIKGAVSESMAYAKSSLGGTVYLQPDITKLREQAQVSGSGAPTPGVRLSFARPDIKVSTVKDLADSSYVKDYTYSVNDQAKASGFTPIEQNTNGPGGAMRFNVQDEDDAALESDVSVQGINSYAFISQVEAGTMKLSSGTYFDESTDNKVILSYDLANSNGIKVGETITLQNIYTEKNYPLEVIGIYDLSEDDGFGAMLGNEIYMNVKTAAQFMGETNYASGDYSVSNVRYFLTSSEYADAFMKEANEKYPTLADENLALSIDISAYEQMVGPIESVGSFATTILWIVVLASVAIVTLIVAINVKDRQYEMGVLLSLGATKANVIGQIFVELLIVGTVAFVSSMATSTLLAQNMSQGLLSSQIAASQADSKNNFGRPSAAPGGSRAFSGGMFFSSGGVKSNAEAISEINVSASAIDYLILFAIGYGIIVLALLLPAWNIVKYQPKTILSGKE